MCSLSSPSLASGHALAVEQMCAKVVEKVLNRGTRSKLLDRRVRRSRAECFMCRSGHGLFFEGLLIDCSRRRYSRETYLRRSFQPHCPDKTVSFASLSRADIALLIVEFLYLGLVPFSDPIRFRPFLKRPPWLCPALLRGFGARSHARDARSRVRNAAGGIPARRAQGGRLSWISL